MSTKKGLKKLRAMLEPGDVILEEGSNKLGAFIKCTNGKLLMTCVNGGFPVQPISIPTLIGPETQTVTRRWK